jgi:hypothetical protein
MSGDNIYQELSIARVSKPRRLVVLLDVRHFEIDDGTGGRLKT